MQDNQSVKLVLQHWAMSNRFDETWNSLLAGRYSGFRPAAGFEPATSATLYEGSALNPATPSRSDFGDEPNTCLRSTSQQVAQA